MLLDVCGGGGSLNQLRTGRYLVDLEESSFSGVTGLAARLPG